MIKTHLVFVGIIIVALYGFILNKADGLEQDVYALWWFIPIGITWFYFIKRAKKKEKAAVQ